MFFHFVFRAECVRRANHSKACARTVFILLATMGNEAQEEEYEEVDALEDSDDDFAYEEVDVDEEDDDLLGEDDEDLETAMRSLHGLGGTGAVGGAATKAPEPAPGEVTKRPEVRARASERERERVSTPLLVFYIFSHFLWDGGRGMFGSDTTPLPTEGG